MTKKFKTAFIAHVPDAKPQRDRCKIETGLYELTSILIKDDDQAIKVCEELAEEGVHSIILCPGFTHKTIARIIDAIGENIGISVARGDDTSTKIALKAMEEAGWFKKG
ncbi:MAG TPA: DUF6506 family protein [Methanothermobacter sp.]|nr:conserved hypothetical protein [Methanothermobacter sp. MT-2]HHW04711.1 hypothetical protein [Methanothermobacter sp.]HOK72811.1 DUF6506 family protein [Methanothermobacter sp.]HOL69104.1 DUF6506 family protein [Methanothermobacter sp.]HPQ04760.1 DUF6506 family protein [Methanothermobacter sp.]